MTDEMTYLGVVSFALFLVSLTQMKCNMIEEQHRLVKQLSNDNSRFVIPRKVKEVIDINVQYSLLQLTEMNELQQTMVTNGYFLFQWMDDSLKWNSSDFDGQDNLFLSTDSVWLPDLTVQTVTQRTMFWEQSGLVSVRSSGLVFWAHGDVFKTRCDFDVSYFPFDTQVCNISLTSWYTTSDKVRLLPLTNRSLIGDSQGGNSLWIIKDVSGEIVMDGFPFLRIAITLKRRPAFYVFNLIIPITLLSLLSSLVFALPMEYGDKTSLSMTVLLAFTVFLSQMTNEMPRTSIQTSYLTIYLTVLLTLSSLAVAMSILILRVHRWTGVVPLMLQRCVSAKICCSRNKTKKEDTLDMTTLSGHNGKKEKSEVRVEWKDVSRVLDALCLRLFMFLNVGCVIALLIILK